MPLNGFVLNRKGFRHFDWHRFVLPLFGFKHESLISIMQTLVKVLR